MALLSTGIASSLAVVPDRARECSRRRRGAGRPAYHEAIGSAAGVGLSRSSALDVRDRPGDDFLAFLEFLDGALTDLEDVGGQVQCHLGWL
jgi:hypothetical protein